MHGQEKHVACLPKITCLLADSKLIMPGGWGTFSTHTISNYVI